MSEEDKKRIFSQIASQVLAGIELEAIAKILELDLDKLKQVIELEAYKVVQKEMLEDRVLREERFNDSWDNIEKHAMRVVTTSLQSSRDGEFALRAAVLANKARRRGPNSNGVIAASQGMRASVNLPMKFVTKIQGRNGELTISHEMGQEGPKVPEQKIDCLLPGQVETLFGSTNKSLTGGAKDDDILRGLTF